MRVRVDRDLCIGAASCIALLPEVFELDEEAKAVIKRLTGDKQRLGRGKRAFRQCQNGVGGGAFLPH